MKLFKSQFNALSRATSKFVQKFFDTSLSLGGWALSKGLQFINKYRGPIYDKAYWLRAYDHCFLVQVPVSRIEEDFAKVKWQLKRATYKRNEPPVYKQIWRHPFLDLLKRPNEDQTGIAFKQMMIRHWLCCGEVIIYIEERNALGEPTKMFLVEPHKLCETPLDNQQDMYRFEIGEGIHTRYIDAPASEVAYWCNPSAFAVHGRGVGKVVALSREVKLDEKSSEWSLAVYDNGSVVGTIVHMPDVEAEDLKALQEEWDKKYTGIDNIGRTLFLSSDSIDGKSPMSVEKMGHGHRELDWTESKKDLLKRALILFGIPPQVVGQIEGGSRSDTSGADYIHQSKNILPLLCRFTEEFEMRLLPQWRGTKNMVVTFENPVREDAAFRHKRLIEGMKVGAVLRDEWRRDSELDPMPGELGNTTPLPLNMHHVDANGKPVVEADTQAPAVREEDDADNAASSVALNHASRALDLLRGMQFEH